MPQTRKRSTPSQKPAPSAQAKGGKAGGNGRGFKPSAEMRTLVEATAGFGLTEDDIAKLVTNPTSGKAISPVTLRQHFREELGRGHAIVISTVANSLYKNATVNENVAAQIFMLKTRARWRERDPIPTAVSLPPPADSEEGLKEAGKRIAFTLELTARASAAAAAPRKKAKARA